MMIQNLARCLIKLRLKHLMEMMGGTIALHSEGLGQGTAMTLTVPIA